MDVKVNIFIHNSSTPEVVYETTIYTYRHNCETEVGVIFKSENIVLVETTEEAKATLKSMVEKELIKESEKLISGNRNNAITKCPFNSKVLSYKLNSEEQLELI